MLKKFSILIETIHIFESRIFHQSIISIETCCYEIYIICFCDSIAAEISTFQLKYIESTVGWAKLSAKHSQKL